MDQRKIRREIYLLRLWTISSEVTLLLTFIALQFGQVFLSSCPSLGLLVLANLRCLGVGPDALDPCFLRLGPKPSRLSTLATKAAARFASMRFASSSK